MNYKNFNDYEILDQIHSCNEDANEIMIYKYRPLIVSIATKMMKYCNGGIDINDLIQEGMLGLNEAVNSFREDKEANFGTYARLCIKRRIICAVRNTRTYKNKVLNESISYEDEEGTLDNLLVDNKTPESYLEDYDNQTRIIETLQSKLTDFELTVFDLKKEGFDYKEIAEVLDKEPKAIDNTIQRIKRKLHDII